jgi:hypothetical protein
MRDIFLTGQDQASKRCPCHVKRRGSRQKAMVFRGIVFNRQ